MARATRAPRPMFLGHLQCQWWPADPALCRLFTSAPSSFHTDSFHSTLRGSVLNSLVLCLCLAAKLSNFEHAHTVQGTREPALHKCTSSARAKQPFNLSFCDPASRILKAQCLRAGFQILAPFVCSFVRYGRLGISLAQASFKHAWAISQIRASCTK